MVYSLGKISGRCRVRSGEGDSVILMVIMEWYSDLVTGRTLFYVQTE
jgi:hypothetical protein